MSHKILAIFILVFSVLVGCAAKESESFTSFFTEEKVSVFVASGACYAGGTPTSSGSGTVASFDPNTGALKRVVIDYNRLSPGDMPVGIQEYSPTEILVLVENVSGRRVDLVKKDGSSISTYLSNSTALNGALRSLVRLSDSSLLISKGSAIEKFSSSRARVMQGATPFVNAPAGVCATSTTLISSVAALSDGTIVYSHSAANPNNKIALVSSNGYATSGDCYSSIAAPSLLAMPTALLVHSTGALLAAYGSTSTANNFIYAYDINVATRTLSAPVLATYNPAVINGPSAMAENPVDKTVFVANGNATFNNIVKFKFDKVSKLLTQLDLQPFSSTSLYLRCVSSIKVLSDN